MEADCAPRGLPPPDQAMARSDYLGEGVTVPGLTAVKDFLRFYIATSRPQIDVKPTVDSINRVLWSLFAGFSCVTATETVAEERSEERKANSSEQSCPHHNP
jgi:hypothetical protein